MRRWIVVSWAVSVVLLTVVLSGHAGAGASAPSLTPATVLSSTTGPGYQLLVSNVAYGFNAPALSTLPTNPTGGGPQICPPQTSGTCTDIGIASVGAFTSPGYWIGIGARFITGSGQVQYGGGLIGFGNTDTCNHQSAVLTNTPVVGVASAEFGALLVAADGGVFAFCNAPFLGSMGGTHLNQPIVGIAATPDGNGYWLVASDGGVFAFGDASFLGSMGGTHLNQPMVGMASTPDGKGYWLVASDGGIFAFGDAGFFGSMGGTHLNQPMVAIAANPDGTGYWTAAADGGVFSFGDAPFRGSASGLGVLQGIAANG